MRLATPEGGRRYALACVWWAPIKGGISAETGRVGWLCEDRSVIREDGRRCAGAQKKAAGLRRARPPSVKMLATLVEVED